ncbi:MAG TPA: serine/threonine-protein kinase [Planctomycetota bacterium]|nr:serine/threonine-protein kinase [Planctomycetota bacterium]
MTNSEFNDPTIKLAVQAKPKIPDIEIEAKIGEGGMGMVFRGKQPYLDRLVAVKVLSSQMTQNALFVERFQREAKILAGLNHPNIVGCYSAGQTDKAECYLAMEYIDGPNLRQWIGKNGRLDELHALEVGRCLLEALSYAHERDIIHRDVKPENVLLQKLTGKEAVDAQFPFKVKLVDLGLARPSSKDSAQTRDMALTVQGTIMGTPATMAPEQFDDPDNVDFKADIYGVGCVLYHALTGEPAYPEQAITAIIKRKSTGEVPDPGKKQAGLRPGVSKLVTDMLQSRRDDRPDYKALLNRAENLLRGAEDSLAPDAPAFNPSAMNPGARTSTSTGTIENISSRTPPPSAIASGGPSNTPPANSTKVVGIVFGSIVAVVAIIWGVGALNKQPTPTIVVQTPPANPPSVTQPPVTPSNPQPVTPPVAPPDVPVVLPPPVAPAGPPDYSQVPVEALDAEARPKWDVNARYLLSPDNPLRGWKSTPPQAWGNDEDVNDGAVGNEISRTEFLWDKTPVKIEGNVVLYNNANGNLEARANQAGVCIDFADGRCLALSLSTPGAITLATVERYDAGLPGIVDPKITPLKHACRKTEQFPGVLSLPKSEKVHFVIEVLNKTVYFEVNDKPLAQVTRLPGQVRAVALFVNGKELQTASFRSLRYYQPAK